MRQLYLALLLIFASIPGTLAANQCAGVTVPDSVTAGGSELTLNGLGLRLATFLKVEVYVAALYVPERSNNAGDLLEADQPWQLSLSFLRSVGSEDMVDAWNEGFASNAKKQLPALKDRIASLNGAMTDLNEGDTLTFSYAPGSGTAVGVNGTEAAIIQGDDFAAALLSIWLGKPPNTEIKTGLLGGKCE